MSLSKTTNQKQATKSLPDEKEKVCVIIGIFGTITMSFPYAIPKREFLELVDEVFLNETSTKEEIEEVYNGLMRIGMDFSDVFKYIKDSEGQVDYCRRQHHKRTNESLSSERFLVMWCAMIYGLIKVGRIQDEGGSDGFIFIEDGDKYSANELGAMISQAMDYRVLIAEQERNAKKAKNDKKRKAKKAKKTAGRTEQQLQEDERRSMGGEDINQAVKHLECCEMMAIAEPCFDYDCDVSLDIVEVAFIRVFPVEVSPEVICYNQDFSYNILRTAVIEEEDGNGKKLITVI
jgi:hypothetical protein